MRDFRVRQSDLIPERCLNFRVGVIGCGAIGSHTVKALAQMGLHDFVLFDDDTVSTENMASQGFSPKDLNSFKVDVVNESIRAFSPNATVDIQCTRFTEDHLDYNSPLEDCDIVIASVDSMEARKIIYKFCRVKNIPVLIDPRMGAEILSLSVVMPNQDEWYQNLLHSDENSVHEPCTAKATIYTAMLLSGLVCKAVKDIITVNNYAEYITWNVRDNLINDYTVRKL